MGYIFLGDDKMDEVKFIQIEKPDKESMTVEIQNPVQKISVPEYMQIVKNSEKLISGQDIELAKTSKFYYFVFVIIPITIIAITCYIVFTR